MSAKLTDQWGERVAEVTRECAAVRQEIADVKAQTAAIQRSTKKLADSSHKEEAQLKKKIQQLEKRASAIDDRHETAKANLSAAEAEKVRLQADYDDLARLVKSMQKDEEDMKRREDLEAVLEKESSSWKFEEAALLQQVADLESQLRKQRKENKAKIAEHETKVKEAEQKLHCERMSRDNAEGAVPAATSLPLAKPPLVPTASNGNATPLRPKQGSRKRDNLGDVTNR